MNGFPHDPSESAPSPLGPAVSSHPSPRRSSLGELAEPLAPFGVRAAQPAPTSSPAPAAPLAPAPDLDRDIGLDFVEPLPSLAPEIDAIDSGSGAVDDLPWIELDEPEEEPVAEPAEPAPAPALSEGSVVWAAAAPAALAPADSSPVPAESTSAPALLEPASAPAPPASDSIAARLEEIARTLREHGPAGLLVGEQRDPLHLLIAGYALGEAAGAERGGAGEE